MTDLYEALRAAIAPDGRVRLTLPLLTAMHEEAELRVGGVAPSKLAFERGYRSGYDQSDRDTLDAMGEPHGTPVHVALVLYREKFAALMRERAETAERELAEMRSSLSAAFGAIADMNDGCFRVERDMHDLIAHARACLDPEIISRDPAHARLAALLERIEGR